MASTTPTPPVKESIRVADPDFLRSLDLDPEQYTLCEVWRGTQGVEVRVVRK